MVVSLDHSLLRTFLEVAASGSFIRAAERLGVTQSAVSLRIQRLEEALGRTLFTRSKAGAEMTAAGRAFERYAHSMIQVWEEARQQVAIPEGFSDSLTIGAEPSQWSRLGFGWIDALRDARPQLSIRAEMGSPDVLTRRLAEGVVDAALMPRPQMRPGLRSVRAMEQVLVMVASWGGASLDDEALARRYVLVDWGAEFVGAHALQLPHLTNTGLTMSLGTQAAEFIRARASAGYLPAHCVTGQIDGGSLHLVTEAPVFPYPVWLVTREDLSADLHETALHTLVKATEALDAEQAPVLARLTDVKLPCS